MGFNDGFARVGNIAGLLNNFATQFSEAQKNRRDEERQKRLDELSMQREDRMQKQDIFSNQLAARREGLIPVSEEEKTGLLQEQQPDFMGPKQPENPWASMGYKQDPGAIKRKELEVQKAQNELDLDDPKNPQAMAKAQSLRSIAERMAPGSGGLVKDGLSLRQLKDLEGGLLQDYVQSQGRMREKQTEAKSQTGLTEGQKAVDKDYAKHYNSFVSTGRNNAVNSIDKLKKLAAEVEQDTGFGEAGGGKIASILPDVLRSSTAIQRRDDARNFANKTLKELFGGQLSDAERESAAREFWNDRLDNKSNAERLWGKIKELEDNLASQEQQANTYEKSGTLKNFRSEPSQRISPADETKAPQDEQAAAGLPPEKKKRLEELRAKKEKGLLN